MLGINTSIERSEAELQHALLIAARSITVAIQEVAALGNFDCLVQTIEELYVLAKLADKHRDIVDTEALAYAAAPTQPLLHVYRSCQLNIRNESDRLDRQERQRLWAQSLPSSNALKELIEAEGNGARWEGLTFWREGDDNYWSVTNAYGIDDVAWARTPQEFQRLINQLRASDGDIGPVPPQCEYDEDGYDLEADFWLYVWDAAELMLNSGRGSNVRAGQ